jgi:O-antigen biosynthesis protein
VDLRETNGQTKAMMLNLLACKMVFAQPMRLARPVAWITHIPFAFAIMELHQPGLFVELGTHSGNSYCAFCQAVNYLELPTKCYAVDTWQGDEHAGHYGEDVFAELTRYHDPRYGSFSNLLRMRFDDALEYFSDGTLDLLHIDGCHHYEAVRNDFFAWLPKLSSRGVVLLHDSFMRSEEFGVWRLVEELRSSYKVFEFTHGHGLAVVAVGPDVAETVLGDLFQDDDRATVAVRRCFATLGKRLMHQHQLRSLMSSSDELGTQIAEMDGWLHQRAEELQQKAGELQQKHTELAAVLGSYSWRITAPLRWANRKMSIYLKRK